MKRFICIICMTMVLPLSLSACFFAKTDSKNPLVGKNKNERIIRALERTYPGRKFHIVKKWGFHLKGNDVYAVCADENGIKFKIDDILYNSRYHFECCDNYSTELLKKQGFPQKVHKIANDNGYGFEYEEENGYIGIRVNIDSGFVDIDKILQTMDEIFSCVDDVPRVGDFDTMFSTGELNYYSDPSIGYVGCQFISSKDDLSIAPMRFNEISLSTKQKKAIIQKALNDSYKVNATL